MYQKALYIFAGLVGLWLLGNLFTGVLQDYFIFRFNPLPADYTFQVQHPFEEVTIASKEGTLHGLYFPNDSASHVVLYFHGNRGNVTRWAEVANQFLHRGYAVFIPDYRGYGKSTGKRSEDHFYADAQLAYEWANKKFANRVVVFGRSLGTAAAAYVAGNNVCSHVLLETPFFSMKDLFYTYYPFLPRMFFFKYEFNNTTYLKNYTGKISVVAGADDMVVPFRSAGKYRDHLKPTDRMLVIENGSHNNLAEFSAYQQFLDEELAH